MFNIKLTRLLQLLCLGLSLVAAMAVMVYVNVRLVQTWSTGAASFPVVVPWGYLLLGGLLYGLWLAIHEWLPASRAAVPTMTAAVFSLVCLILTGGYSRLVYKLGHQPHVGVMIVAYVMAGFVTIFCCLAVCTIAWMRPPSSSE